MTLNQLQIAKTLRINRVYVARLIRQGKIKAKKDGRAYKVKSEDVEGFIGAKYNQKFYTISEIADLLKIHRTMVSKLIHQGDLKAVNLGRFFLVPQAELKKLTKTEIPQEFYTIGELVETTRTPRTTIIRAIERNQLKAIRLDKEIRVGSYAAADYFHIQIKKEEK